VKLVLEGTFTGIGQQHSLRCSVEVVILAATHRPDERKKSSETHAKCDWHKPGQIAHIVLASPMRTGRVGLPETAFLPGMRIAFPTTRIDEEDMAIAARSGVT
jgi:hypothetical protein